MRKMKLKVIAVALSLSPFACKVLDRSAELNESSREDGADRYRYVNQDDRSASEKYAELIETAEAGAALVPLLGPNNRGYKKYRLTYESFGNPKTIDASYRLKDDSLSKCAADKYIEAGELKDAPGAEAKACAAQLAPAISDLVVSMEFFVEAHQGFVNALKNFMGAKYAMLEVAAKPMYVDPKSSEPPKTQLKAILDAAVKDVPLAHVAMYPTVHFDKKSGKPACLSQTLVMSPLDSAPEFEWITDREPSKSAEAADDELAYQVNGSHLRFSGDTRVDAAMRGYYRQEYVAGLFSSDFDAYSTVQYMPLYAKELTPEDTSAYFDDDFNLTCSGSDLADADAAQDDGAEDKSASSKASCMILRGTDIDGADKCPQLSLRVSK